jgi:hypothetical protein
MIGKLMPIAWIWTTAGKVPCKWAGWVDFGPAAGGVQWIEVKEYQPKLVAVD